MEDHDTSNMTQDEMVAAGLMEGPNYRDFPPSDEFDMEAQDEMYRQDRESEMWR